MDPNPGMAREINEAKTLKLWVRRKPGTRKRICSGCGPRIEEVEQLPSKAPLERLWSQPSGIATATYRDNWVPAVAVSEAAVV